MSCLEVEDDELVNVVCPGSITAEAEDRNYVGAYLTAIYPGANTFFSLLNFSSII
jgi:hypothetical protein